MKTEDLRTAWHAARAAIETATARLRQHRAELQNIGWNAFAQPAPIETMRLELQLLRARRDEEVTRAELGEQWHAEAVRRGDEDHCLCDVRTVRDDLAAIVAGFDVSQATTSAAMDARPAFVARCKGALDAWRRIVAADPEGPRPGRLLACWARDKLNTELHWPPAVVLAALDRELARTEQPRSDLETKIEALEHAIRETMIAAETAIRADEARQAETAAALKWRADRAEQGVVAAGLARAAAWAKRAAEGAAKRLADDELVARYLAREDQTVPLPPSGTPSRVERRS